MNSDMKINKQQNDPGKKKSLSEVHIFVNTQQPTLLMRIFVFAGSLVHFTSHKLKLRFFTYKFGGMALAWLTPVIIVLNGKLMYVQLLNWMDGGIQWKSFCPMKIPAGQIC